MFKFRLFLFILTAIWIFPADANAGRQATIHSFCSDLRNKSCLDGKTPVSRLAGINGQFYGTTTAGGTKLLGTVFRVSANGSFTVLHDFCRQAQCPDGARPGNYLTAGPYGAIYGVTGNGGLSDGGGIFKLSAAGTFSVVYRFCRQARCSDGQQPVAVLFDGKGQLFGTASAGGKHGGGTAFVLEGANLRVLYNFCSKPGCSDGALPGALIKSRDGNFYGTTQAGGLNHAGTVFRMTPAGKLTILHSFCDDASCTDGEQPAPALVEAPNGDLLGATTQRGSGNNGTLFAISPAGTLRTLHSFCAVANCADGASPTDGPILGKDGALYGAASGGGRFYNGVVYRVTPSGGYSVIYDFCALHGCFDGAVPGTSPTVGADGSLFGTTENGGDKGGFGAVYRLVP